MPVEPESLPARERITADWSVGLVIPLYNEEDVAAELIREIETFRSTRPFIREVVIVDDGSRDQTLQILKSTLQGLADYKLIVLSRNFGQQIAFSAGLSFIESDAAVLLDGDLQDPLEVIDRMVDQWQAGHDVVFGIREKREGESLGKRLAAALYYRLLRWSSETELPLDTGDFRLVSRPVLDAFLQIEEQQPFVRGLISWLGFRQTGVRYVRKSRAAGNTKYSVRRMMRLAIDGITSFTDGPLRLAIRLGLATALLALIGGAVWIVLAKFVYGTAIQGWASLLFVVVFLGGVQLFFLGIVGLYLSRVYESVKGRPRYVVREVWKSGHSQ